MNENLWILSVKDFFTKKMLGYALIPFIFTIVVLYGFFFSLAGAGLEQLQQSVIHIEQSQTTIQNGQSHTENIDATYTGSGILRFLMEHSVTSWLISFFVFTVGGMFIFIAAVFSALLIIGFLTPAITREIQRRHYPQMELKSYGNPVSTLLNSLKYLLITLFLFLFLMPLYFIPLINMIAINLPFYYLFHKFYLLDVTSETLNEEEYRILMFYRGTKMRINTGLLYVLSLIPFAAFITPVFNVILLSHAVFRNSQEALRITGRAEGEKLEYK